MSNQKFEEYKMLIDDSARFSERRQNVTNTYITVNSLLLTAIAFIYKDSGMGRLWITLLPIPLVIAGVFVSVWWFQLIQKYKNLVGLRMDVLYEMENSKELADLEKIYHVEEKYYKRDEKGNMLEDKVTSFSDVESKLPFMFGTLHLIFGLILLVTFFVRAIVSVFS